MPEPEVTYTVHGYETELTDVGDGVCAVRTRTINRKEYTKEEYEEMVKAREEEEDAINGRVIEEFCRRVDADDTTPPLTPSEGHDYMGELRQADLECRAMYHEPEVSGRGKRKAEENLSDTEDGDVMEEVD